MSTPKLPKGQPPVPAGYNRWDCKGWGWASNEAVGALWCIWDKQDRCWSGVLPEGSEAMGYGDRCYYVAVRDPKPAPTVKPRSIVAPKKRKGRVVAKVMYLSPHGIAYRSYVQAKSAGWNPADLTRIECLPADAASIEQMVEQVAETIGTALACNLGDLDENSKSVARVALAAIGIKTKGGRK